MKGLGTRDSRLDDPTTRKCRYLRVGFNTCRLKFHDHFPCHFFQPTTFSDDLHMCPSTFSPISELKRDQVIIPNESSCPRRQVHFAKTDENGTKMEVLAIHAASPMSDEEKEVIWWNKADLNSFSENARLLADAMARRDDNDKTKGFKMVFVNSHLSCNQVDGPSAEQRHYAKQWVKAAFSLRGIEHLCIAELAENKAEDRKKTIRAVLDAQQCCSSLSPDQQVEFIQSMSECRSLGARNFGRLLGDCDAYAAAQADVVQAVPAPVQQSKSKTLATLFRPTPGAKRERTMKYRGRK